MAYFVGDTAAENHFTLRGDRLLGGVAGCGVIHSGQRHLLPGGCAGRGPALPDSRSIILGLNPEDSLVDRRPWHNFQIGPRHNDHFLAEAFRDTVHWGACMTDDVAFPYQLVNPPGNWQGVATLAGHPEPVGEVNRALSQ